MKIGLICFTKQGASLCAHISEKLKEMGYDSQGFAKGSFEKSQPLDSCDVSLAQWTGTAFSDKGAIVFVGATGIAVRAIAPYLKDKTADPAVIVIDELGRHVIPLVSGHIGGANHLALQIAELIHATPVITTATDLNHRFAVDQWAKEQGLYITDMQLAKRISAELLQGNDIGFSSDCPIVGDLPEGLLHTSCNTNITVSIKNNRKATNTLQLIPQILVLGIGCRRGTEVGAIEECAWEALEKLELSPQSVCLVTSIDLKESEKGLIEFCKKKKLPFQVFTKEELQRVPGQFTPSAFVKSVTGVDNVCERAALLGSGDGKLLVNKYAKNGVTVAVAQRNVTYYIEKERNNG